VDRAFAYRLALYAAFLAWALFQCAGMPGEDLSASYIGCRLIASGGIDRLFDHDPALFDIVNSPAWTEAAQSAGFVGKLHPYVQTPLWAWSLQPLCTTMDFQSFNTLFQVLGVCATIGAVEIVARTWAPKFLQPLPLGILLAAIAVSAPFKYALWLGQTHMLFVLLALLAAAAAERRADAAAGIALALAAAVKITPGFLALYWLVRGEWKPAAWFAGASAVLAALTAAATGWDATTAYIATLQRVSGVLLAAFNNQSLAAFLSPESWQRAYLLDWRMLPLAGWLKLLSIGLVIASAAGAGWLSRGGEAVRRGAALSIALIGITVFTPIAWSHYFLVLIPAAMLLAQAGGRLMLPVLAVVFLLDIPPIAFKPIHTRITPVTLTHSHFLAGLLAMAVLGFVAWRRGAKAAT
jgi:hypothetical protein